MTGAVALAYMQGDQSCMDRDLILNILYLLCTHLKRHDLWRQQHLLDHGPWTLHRYTVIMRLGALNFCSVSSIARCLSLFFFFCRGPPDFPAPDHLHRQAASRSSRGNARATPTTQP